MSRDLFAASEKFYELVNQIEDDEFRGELLLAAAKLIQEARYSGRPRDVLDMD